MAAVTIWSDFGAKKVKSVTVSFVSPSICHEVKGNFCIAILILKMEEKATFSAYADLLTQER